MSDKVANIELTRSTLVPVLLFYLELNLKLQVVQLMILLRMTWKGKYTCISVNTSPGAERWWMRERLDGHFDACQNQLSEKEIENKSDGTPIGTHDF